MIDDADYALLDRYIAGECSPAERERVEEWFGADESRSQLLIWLQTVRQAALSSSGNDAESDELWRVMRMRMKSPSFHVPALGASPNTVDGSSRRVRTQTPRFAMSVAPRWWDLSWVRVSAAVAAAIALVVGWQIVSSEPASSATATTYRTGRAQRTIVRLHDGTRVTLAASSTLNVPDAYGRRDREVQLSGEAYFDVATDHARPFRVRGEGAMAEAVGTRFGVRAYPEDQSVAVVVEEGVVAVGATIPTKPVERIVLSRGDLARVERGGRVLLERGVIVSRYLGWVHGRLEFIDAPLADVVREISRWYDVNVIVNDSALAHSRLSASFSTESLNEVISALAASVEARAEYTGRTVKLSPLQ